LEISISIGSDRVVDRRRHAEGKQREREHGSAQTRRWRAKRRSQQNNAIIPAGSSDRRAIPPEAKHPKATNIAVESAISSNRALVTAWRPITMVG
jgi:hypothetical protein